MIFQSFRRVSKRLKAALAVLLSIEVGGVGLQAQTLPNGGIVRAGDARIATSGSLTRIDQASDRAIIDWRSFSIGAGGQVVFVQPSALSATLNRVTGEQASMILGRLDANGQVLLINPNGIVFGGGSQINVASLIASTSNVSNTNFMAGRLIFDQPGRPGAGILNAGAMTAADGGLIALVAPHVRNDGVIVARLGKVTLGAADTFTVDLYGDSLINLALSDVHAGQLRDLSGAPVSSLIANSGTIDTAGGRTVLMTARNAKNILDNLINMSGTIKADTAVEQSGRILLLGEGGKVDVSGTLSARGATGGSIEALGGEVHVASTATADASGAAGGGIVHVGGAFQGKGDTYRSTQTLVDAGATLRANAGDRGNGGEVVVWSDGRTAFSGSVEAKGGANGGGGGRMEVSGKGTLEFLGQADASATAGQAGSLLLDPAYLDIGATEAGVITRVLRTGTTANLAADVDISVNSIITGGDRTAGGGLTMTAGNNININDFLVTNEGAISLFASKGSVNVAPGKALFAGMAPITVSAAGSVHTAPLVTGGKLAVTSTAGSVHIDSFIDSHAGPVSLRAAGDVDINQPIVNLAGGATLDVTAGNDINVNAQVDGRGDAAGGAVTMTANRNLNVNDTIVTNNGGITLAATNGAMNVAQGKVIVSGTGTIAMSARGDINAGATSGGALTINSSGGSVAVNGLIDSATGATRISAGTDVNINQPILNAQSGSSLAVNAGRDVNVNAQIDGRGGVAGGGVALNAARNLNLNQSLATNNGAITLAATGGAATVATGKGLFSGNAPISMQSAGDLTMGLISGGSLSATSSGGSLRVNGVIDGTTGRVDLNAGQDVLISQPVLNVRTGNALNVNAGRDVTVNAQIDGRNGASGGGVNLIAARDVAVNDAIVTNNGAIGITANGGAARVGSALVSGSGSIAVKAAGDVTTSGISGGSMSATSTGGSVNINGMIDGGTGRVDLSAGRDVNINQPVLNIKSGGALNATAGTDINVNARIDGSTVAKSGAVALAASRDVNVNASIATSNGAISVSAANGRATVGTNLGLFAGASAISMNALGNVTTGTLSGGPMNVVSRAGAVTISGPISGNGGAMTINAGTQVDVARAISNPGTISPLTITAGTDINVNAAIDGRTSTNDQSSAVTLTARQNVNLNKSIDAKDAPISVTATQGTVTTAASQGLFAGSGAITVESGQTLSTGITSTTGTLTLRSTNSSVNVDTPISGETGAVTIQAAADVNVNQAISNKRNDAPLSVSAGHDINVNAAIDGRDSSLSGSSGAITMTAGNDIGLNQSIVSRDGAISLTATNGTIVSASGMGLFAGSGTIAETTGGTLNTGITSTTGALNLRSTGGGININTAIDDTTGAVTVNAANAVNINKTITNLKSGNNLLVTAGTDINVLAQIDGRSGVAGGTATLTAGNNLNLTKSIATNNGAVALTATTGSVTVPTGVETAVQPMEWIVSAGNAPVSITSGSNFSLNSPINTTGSLAITSTGGNVNIAAPITDDTGAVTITAGNGITVNHQVKSNNQPITLNAGAGGIVVNPITDFDLTLLSPVNSGSGNLTFNSIGNVSILENRGISSTATVTIDTRGQIVTGRIGDASLVAPIRPQSVILNADQGIASFFTGFADSVTATSSGGSISLNVSAPNRLRITTGTPGTLDCPTCNISLSSSSIVASIGPDVVLNAGGSVNLSTILGGTFDFTARNYDVNFNSQVTSDRLTATAGRDINLAGLFWVGNTPGQAASGGPLTLTAGRNIVTTVNSPIHVGNVQPLTLTAGQDLTLNILEALGPVSFTSTNGNITLNNDIGPHIINVTTDPDFNPGDLGVASLTISAPSSTAAVMMQGARAEGNVTITTGGSLTAAKAITSVSGTVAITTGGAQNLSAVPIGSQNQLDYPPIVAPVVPPGPKAPLPTAPSLAGAGAPGLPTLGEILVAAADQIVAGVISPGGATGHVGVAGIPGGAGAPGVTGGSNSVPGSPSAPAVAQATGQSDPGSADTASGHRAADQGCGKESGEGSDDGLEAVKPEKASQSSEQKNPACGAGASGQAAPATAPASAPPAGATPAAPTGSQTGGGSRR
jgi:filamentous hemagglutinin family protein